MGPDQRSVPTGPVRAEDEVRRSRFLAELTPVPDRESAEAEIARRRREHPQASHVVYAFITGSARSEVSGMSDDGEPRGTAGRPVMEILKGSGLTNTLITVVRYYGGTNLGTGGLVRAYGDAARRVIAGAERRPFRILREYTLEVPYDLHRPVRTILEEFRVEIRGERFTEQVEMVIACDEDYRESLEGALRNVSRGTLRVCFT